MEAVAGGPGPPAITDFPENTWIAPPTTAVGGAGHHAVKRTPIGVDGTAR